MIKGTLEGIVKKAKNALKSTVKYAALTAACVAPYLSPMNADAQQKSSSVVTNANQNIIFTLKTTQGNGLVQKHFANNLPEGYRLKLIIEAQNLSTNEDTYGLEWKLDYPTNLVKNGTGPVYNGFVYDAETPITNDFFFSGGKVLDSDNNTFSFNDGKRYAYDFGENNKVMQRKGTIGILNFIVPFEAKLGVGKFKLFDCKAVGRDGKAQNAQSTSTEFYIVPSMDSLPGDRPYFSSDFNNISIVEGGKVKPVTLGTFTLMARPPISKKPYYLGSSGNFWERIIGEERALRVDVAL